MSISKFDLTGKVALVTGGNGGIGLGMASALAESGADICIWGRNETKNQAAEDVLKAYGRRTLALKCDVTAACTPSDCVLGMQPNGLRLSTRWQRPLLA